MADPNVQWLFDEMNNAGHTGALLTIQTIIKLEIESGEAYTKDEVLMQRLRQCWKQNEARVIKADEELEEELVGSTLSELIDH